MDIHYNKIVIDGHNDTTLKVINEDTWLPENDIGKETHNQIDLPKLAEGGLDIAMFSAYTGGYYKNSPKSLSRTLSLLNALYWVEGKNKDKFEIVHESQRITEIFKEKLGAIPTIEGAYALVEDNYLDLLKQFRDLGIKVIGFNWNYSNDLGEGIAQVYSDGKSKSSGGLTDLGKKALRQMKRLGIGIDISHMNEETFWGVVDNVDNPIIATHSGAYNIKQHKRNLKDDQLQAIKDSNGIVGVVFYPAFISDEKEASVDDIVKHIDYIVDLIGIDHVGLGSDFDGATLPQDMKDSSEIYKITEKLVEKGYSNDDIEKILGGNYLRVFRTLEANRDEVEYLDLNIDSNYQMGSLLKEDQKLLVNLSRQGDFTGSYILNGKVIQEFKLGGSKLEFNLKFPNEEIFHVLTIEIKDQAGRLKRDTKILVNDRNN